MRTYLFVPGDSPRKFAKAREGAADALIIDLEDSVPPEGKDAAREVTRAMLAEPRGAQALFVRVNPLDSGRTLGDLAAIMPEGPDGVVLPKSQGGHDIRTLSLWLDAMEAAFGQEAGRTKIVAIATETAPGIFGLGTYAGASDRLQGLMWGAEDLAAAIGASENGRDGVFHEPFRLARNLCLFGAAAAGVAAIDSVHTRIDDIDGLVRDAREARLQGFAGKAVIHPKHVDPVNAAFTPSEEEVAFARRVIEAFGPGETVGVARLDGRMIDKPHLKAAQKVLLAAGLDA